jgi:hypothetical protein
MSFELYSVNLYIVHLCFFQEYIVVLIQYIDRYLYTQHENIILQKD